MKLLKKEYTLILMIAVVFLLSFLSSVNADEPNFTETYSKYVEEGAIPGAVLIVATPSNILSCDCVGYADVKSKKALDGNSMFWIASNTKAIVATAVMICVDEGLLELDAPAENYLPELKNLKVARLQEDGSVLLTEPKTKPTLRQALSHTAGFSFITPYQRKYGIDSLPVQRLITTIAMNPLIDDPGARYNYSNDGIDVGQAAVEVVTGKKFEDFLRERIFEPLDMNDTTFYPTEEQWSRLAIAYCWDKEAKCLKDVPIDQMPSLYDGSLRYAEGGGGLFSTPNDFIKFFQMLGGKGVGANGKRIVSEKAVEIMSSKQTGDSVNSQYGFGLTVNNETFGHGGAFGTQGVAYKDGSVVAVYMVAVAGLPKQGEAEWVFRNYVDYVSKHLQK